MSEAAPVRYVALRSFQASHNGEVWNPEAGDELPNAGEWDALDRMIEHGYVALLPLPGSLASYDDDELLAEVKERGYKVTRPQKIAA